MTRRSPQAGFTLIETIAAIVILAIAVPPMLWSVKEAHAQRTVPMQVSQARWLAVEKLEDIIADRHSTTRGYDYLSGSNYPDESTVNGFVAFSRAVAFKETTADLQSAGEGYMIVTVKVTWSDLWGAGRSVTISTVLTEYDT